MYNNFFACKIQQYFFILDNKLDFTWQMIRLFTEILDKVHLPAQTGFSNGQITVQIWTVSLVCHCLHYLIENIPSPVRISADVYANPCDFRPRLRMLTRDNNCADFSYIFYYYCTTTTKSSSIIIHGSPTRPIQQLFSASHFRSRAFMAMLFWWYS